MSKQQFEAVIEEASVAGGAFITIPFGVQEVYATKGRVKVKATFDGHPYRGSLAPMGGKHVLGVRKAVRQAIGKNYGDTVNVVIELDTEPPTITVPKDFKQALTGDKQAQDFFDSLSYTHRKEYVQWIEGAKKTETRTRRLNKAIENLMQGIKAP